MKKLVFATNNPNKIQEVNSILDDRFEVLSLEDIQCFEDIPEDGDTLEENARQKSDYVVKHFGLNCFADDYGLEVEALNNEPGVYSARYSGSRDMDRNIQLLLENLKDHSNKKARFRTVISLHMDGANYLFEGIVEGVIIDKLKGDRGFGYDPIFIPSGYDKTFAQMTPEEKNSISHRAIAVRKLVDFLGQ